MPEKQNQKKKVLILVLVLGLVLLTIGGTYAFFTYSRQGEKINTLTTGTMYFVYDELPNQDGNQISISNAFPVTDDEGKNQDKPGMFEFEVRAKTQGAEINYEVYLTKGTNNTGLEELPEKVIRTYLTSVNEGVESPIANQWTEQEINRYSKLWYSQVPPVKEDLSGRTLLQDTVLDSPNEYKKTFRYRMWIGDNAEGIDEEGNWIYGNKSFTVKVNVYATNEKLPDPIPPINYIKSWAIKECYDNDGNGIYNGYECSVEQLETDFHAPEYRKKITSISFSNTLDIQEEAIQEWDVSDEEDGSIKAYLIDDGKESGTYKVIIATDRVVYANPDSSEVFHGFSSLKELNFENYDTSYATNMSGMLRNCAQLQSVDLSGLNTHNVTSIQYMFQGCRELTTLDLSDWDTSSVTDMSYLFSSCSQLQSIDLSGWNTSNVTTMRSMFGDYTMMEFGKLSEVKGLEGFDTRKVTDMSSMFAQREFYDLSSISEWDTSSVTDMSHMFQFCNQITDFSFLENWNTSKVIDMSDMFWANNSLTKLNLSNWDTSSVTNMLEMFMNCYQLSTEITIRGNVTSYASMFSSAATAEGASITVNYTDETETIVDAMIKTGGSHIHKGEKVAPLA